MAEVNAPLHSEIAAIPANASSPNADCSVRCRRCGPRIGKLVTRKVDRLSCIRFGSARYSVPTRHVGRQVEVRGVDGVVQIVMLGTVIAEHSVVSPGEASVNDDHYGGARPARGGSPGRLVLGVAYALAVLLLGACADFRKVDSASPTDDNSTPEPAGPLVALNDSALFVAGEAGNLRLARINTAGERSGIPGSLPVALSPGLALGSDGKSVILTGVRNTPGCDKSASCSTEFVAAWLSVQDSVVVEHETVLASTKGPATDADSVRLLGASSTSAWFAVPGSTVETKSTGELVTTGPEIPGVGCVLDDRLVEYSSAVDPVGSSAQFSTRTWPEGSPLGTSPEVAPGTGSSPRCTTNGLTFVPDNSAPTLSLSADATPTPLPASPQTVAATAESVSGQPLITMSSDGGVDVWTDKGPVGASIRFNTTNKNALPPRLYAGVDAVGTVFACLRTTSSLTTPERPDKQARGDSTITCSSATP